MSKADIIKISGFVLSVPIQHHGGGIEVFDRVYYFSEYWERYVGENIIDIKPITLTEEWLRKFGFYGSQHFNVEEFKYFKFNETIQLNFNNAQDGYFFPLQNKMDLHIKTRPPTSKPILRADRRRTSTQINQIPSRECLSLEKISTILC